MGYRSQVAFAIRGKRDDIIPVLMTFRLTNSGNPEGKAALDECYFSENAAGIVTILYHGEDQKWYPEFEEVIMLMKLFNAFDECEDDPKFDGHFIRIGEESNDIEEQTFGNDPYDMISLNQSINIDVPCGSQYTLESILK